MLLLKINNIISMSIQMYNNGLLWFIMVYNGLYKNVRAC
jgi:hypothetical protein